MEEEADENNKKGIHFEASYEWETTEGEEYCLKAKAMNNGHLRKRTHAPSPFLAPSNDHTKAFNIIVRPALCACANLETTKGRRYNAFLILTISSLPVLALIIQNAVDVRENNNSLAISSEIKGDVLFSVESGEVVHYMQIERGTSALYISSGRDVSVKLNLDIARVNTDKAIQALSSWPGVASDGPNYVSEQAFHQSIQDWRWRVDSNATVPQNIKFYTDNIAVMIRWLADGIQSSHNGGLWSTLVSYHMLIISKEQAGLERALGSTFFAQGKSTRLLAELFIFNS